jgi:hypothetical protein
MATIYSLYLLDPCLVYDPLQGAEAIGSFSVSSVLPGAPSPNPQNMLRDLLDDSPLSLDKNTTSEFYLL